MNLYFLVEGDETETQLYSSWVPHVFVGYTQIENYQRAADKNFFIVSGGGYPQYFNRLIQSFENLVDTPNRYQHFFICIDSEEMSAKDKHAEVSEAIKSAVSLTSVMAKNAALRIHIVIQNCCIETWFLGNRRVMSRNPTSEKLIKFRDFYNILEEDPEGMPTLSGYVNRANFHLEYLKEMFREKNIRYTKSKPGCVLESYYITELRNRHQETEHIQTLGNLLGIWDEISE